MNVLFLSLFDFDTIEERNIYTDLLREFRKNGHELYVISPVERKRKIATHIQKNENVTILKLKIGNIQKTNMLEKGISTMLIESLFIAGIKRFFSNVKFDIVLYSTPPITFCNVIRFVKERDQAFSYLMLKDIFPQNSLDLGILTRHGLKGILTRYFERKEKKLYALSDKIGCMSPANIRFLLQHHPNIPKQKVELCPNSAELLEMSPAEDEKISLREKYGIPLDRTVFVYGGNLGKPQGIDFIISCLRRMSSENIFFLIVGSGTEFFKIQNYVDQEKPDHVKLMKSIAKVDYDVLISSCDAGLIFLDYRFTIPNYPSRLLAYLQAGIPVLAVTDPTTDIGEFLETYHVGRSCPSNDAELFAQMVLKMTEQSWDREKIQTAAKVHFHVKDTYALIMRSYNENCCQ